MDITTKIKQEALNIGFDLVGITTAEAIDDAQIEYFERWLQKGFAAGMRWCERIWTTIATCKKQERNIFEFIHKSLLSNWTDKNILYFCERLQLLYRKRVGNALN